MGVGSKWTLEKCQADALRFKTRKEWQANSPGYKAAFKKGWLEKCCQHMEILWQKKWNTKKCMESALEYNSRSEWANKEPQAYAAAQRFGILKKCTKHMALKLNYWNTNSCKKDALRFKTRKEWQTNSRGAYGFALENGLLDVCCSHMQPSKTELKWTLKACKQDALRYISKKEWQINSPSAYQKAQKNKWLEECCRHMKKYVPPIKKWTKAALKEDALKYTTKSEWAKHSPGAYEAALKLKALDEMASHMDILWEKKWDKGSISEEAKKYKTRNEWATESKGSYSAALKLGAFDEMTGHMPKKSGTSRSEQDLLSVIKEKFPKAHSTFFPVKDPKFSPAKRFQLDIYIPELRKGIEFNGNYWHSFNGLARSRKKLGWTDEQIENYHELKRSFFQEKNIEILEIWEKDWKANREHCLSKCYDFLNIGFNDTHKKGESHG